jgi:choline dehydrogenase-like flavoprotein
MTPPAADHADVLIIGAGPAGGVAARRLAAEGIRVTVLEQGHWPDREAYRGAQWDWELAAGKPWASHPNLRGRPTDYPIDFSQSDMQAINFNGVGGGTVLFNAIWIRFLESTFRTRSQYGLGDDWPVGYEELRPFYERTDAEFGVSGLGGNPAYPPGAEPPLPPLPFNKESVAVARAIARRGWHWWPDTNAILSTPYDGRLPHRLQRRRQVLRRPHPLGQGGRARRQADHRRTRTPGHARRGRAGERRRMDR